jgi:ketosteroid isomerase-like protein
VAPGPNAEIVRRWGEAFDDDAGAFSELTHPQVEWMPFEDNHTPSLGLERALAIRQGWLDAWEEHHIDIEDIVEGGDDVLATVVLIGRGKESGVGVDVRLYGHFRIADGKVVYFYEHLDRGEALRAAGLA